jgi:phosphoglycolate phosphatase-like HAD superfamily hydrolase
MTTPADIIETFYIVDFDRTLADSDKLLEVFIEISQQFTNIPLEQIEAADRDVKARGDSFDTAGYVRDRLSSEDNVDAWANLEKQFIHESRALNMLLPEAHELLEWLQQSRNRYGILTYGNPLWQRLKLTAAGFKHVKHIIMEYKEKGRMISSWQQPDGTFLIPEALGGGIAKRIVMIDDKAASFVDFPESPSKGYWVLDLANALPSQLGEVPENVEHVTSIEEFLGRI